jgi:hypothetical protein
MVLLKIASLGQKLTETQYFLVVTPYCASVIHNGLVYEFLWVLKKLKFMFKIHVLAYVLAKITSLGQKLTETQYFLVVTPILWISYT